MIYPSNFEEKTGFEKIREMIKEACISDPGREVVESMKASYTYDTVLTRLQQTEEFRNILLMSEPFPAQNYMDLRIMLKEIRLPGTFLEPEILGDLRASLNTLLDITQFFSSVERRERYPLLTVLSSEVLINPDIPAQIDSVIDEKNSVRNGASEKLSEIRQKIKRKQSGIHGRINKLLTESRQKGIIKDDAEVTIRNGRPVIPVPASNKRKLKGWIHDESATGQTIFIEPAEIFEINNEIRELELQERREIVKILIHFADYLRPDIEVISNAIKYLGEFDFIRAKAKVALATASVIPVMRRRPVLNIRNARHPLLYLSLKKQGRKVVPLTLELSHKERILVISGPNAGGKSICLKTIGLLQYMLQCGILVPVNENSEFGIFRNLLIDIGDEQSLENDLSTYTSHLQNLKVFLRNADRHTLFLIDEFGTGTEPNLGGAIAEATLEQLNNQKAWGVVTTHYANLKLMSSNHTGIINGAMLFDTKKLQPLFILKTGKPGSSFAFEMARKIGFPEEILTLAGTKTGKKQLDFDQQLHQLEIEKKDLTQKQTELTVADDMLRELLDKYKNRITQLEKERNNIIKEAQNQADKLITEANTRIEHTIKEIREVQAEKEKTKKLRKELKETAGKQQRKKHQALLDLKKDLEEIEDPAPQEQPTIIKQTKERFAIGDTVRMQGQKSVGIITGLKGNKATIEFDSLSLKADIKNLEHAQHQENGSTKQVRLTTSNSGNIVHDLTTKAANFKITIDVRGQRAEEALFNISKYMDDAILLNVPEIKILHGKGNGILRDVIRDYLRTMPEVRKYNDEDLEHGGHGITIVSFRY